MKRIHILLYVLMLHGMHIITLQACDSSTYSDQADSDYSSRTSLASSSFDYDEDEEFFYFIERPRSNFATYYFEVPTVIQAVINRENEEELTILKPLDYVIGNKSFKKAPLLRRDFIQCHGPARELEVHQYKKLLETNNYPDKPITRLVQNTLSLQDYLQTSLKKTVEYKNSSYKFTT